MEIDHVLRQQVISRLTSQLKLPEQLSEQALELVLHELDASTRATRVVSSKDPARPPVGADVEDELNPSEAETFCFEPPEAQGASDAQGPLEDSSRSPNDTELDASPQTFIATIGFDLTPTAEVAAHAPSSSETELLSELPPLTPDRYVRVTQLGQGGMGEVWRVYDRCLDRHLALKVIRSHLEQQGPMQALFVREARLVAQLQHPSIIPIHDLGLDSSARPCFIMDEVVGETLSQRIKSLHSSATEDRWPEGEWSLRRLIDVLYRASEAVAYAHSVGINHRDLKPENLLLGEHGEVWVIDWGLAGVRGEADVQMGGTPYYMPPEQLNSKDPMVLTSPALDVFSLGATLFELLAGAPPFSQQPVTQILRKLKAGEVPQLKPELQHQRPVPVELIELCHEAMSTSPAKRPTDAGVFASRLRMWLDGAKRQEKAREMVASSQLKLAESRALLERSAQLNDEATSGLKRLAKNAPPQVKSPWWALQGEADRAEVSAARLESERYAMLLGALMEDPMSREALRTLAARSLERHRRAERARDEPQAQAIADELQRHIERLPHGDLTRQTALHYLSGISHFSLTLPVKAKVTLERYEPVHKRVIPKTVLQLGEVDSISLELPIGSYRVLINAEGYEEVTYPFFLERGCSWDQVGPNDDVTPLPLPKLGSIKPWERYVPRSWFYAGGDPEAPFGLPEHTLWVEGFVISAQPITHAQYIEFLNDLQAQGRGEEALRWAPREQAVQEGAEGQLVYSLERGRFSHPRGDELLNHPVTQVSWHSARAYAGWLSEKEGYRYRLPLELEWEKAARGVDRRCFPWGDLFDPSYCVMMDSHDGQPQMFPVDHKLVDVSPYGVQGCSGNVREWCLDLYSPDSYKLDQHGLRPRLPTQEELESPEFRSSRGGSYGNAASRARASDRDWWFPTLSYLGRGMRVARAFEPGEA